MVSWYFSSPFPPGQAGTQREESRAAPTPQEEPWLHQTWGAQEEWVHTSRPGRHPGSAPCLCLSPPPVPILLSNSTSPLLSDTRKSFPLRSWRQGDQGQLGPFPPSPPCPLQPALASALGWPLCLPALGPPLSACRSGWPACCVIGLLGSAGSDLSLLWPRSLPPAAHPSLLQTGPCTAFLDCHSPPPLFFYPISLFPFAVFGNLLSVRPEGSSVCMKPRVWHVSLYSQTQ